MTYESMNYPAKVPRVLLDCIVFGLQQHGGISNYWSHLIDSYNEVFPELIFPKQCCFAGIKDEWFSRLIVRRESIPTCISRYFSFEDFGACDVFHTSYYRIPARKPRKYVVTAYDFMYERYRVGLARLAHTTQKRRSLERADIISCISSFTRDEVLEFYPNINPTRLYVVPLGVDTKTYYPNPNSTDKFLALTVLFVGLRGGYKRFDLALNALRASDNRLILGIVGPTLSVEEKANLDSLLPGRWRYFSAVSSSSLRELYSSAFALIYPSDCEGFGLPILEAMACNCPVVAANRASLPEAGGDAAFYAKDQHPDSYAKALNLLADSSLRSLHINKGAARVLQFSWDEACRKTRSLYEI